MKMIMPLSDGFEEIEALSVTSVLRGNGIGVDIVGISGSTITSGSGTRVLADRKMTDVRKEDYSGIIIPGGKGCDGLQKSRAVLDLIAEFYKSGKLVAGICLGPVVLAKAGILEDRRAVVYPGMEKEIPFPRSERVMVDGNVITSQGPAMSLEFALAIVEYLIGKDKAERSRKYLLA
jgi:protein deglycase